MLNDYFDHIYLLNLDRRTDRMYEVNKALTSLGIEYERFSATDAKQLGIKGSDGCRISHMNIIRDAKEKGYKTILIFEDDVTFKDDFVDRLKSTEVPDDWQMLYLGGSLIHQWGRVNDSLVASNGIHTTHAYAIKSEIFDYILENMQDDDILDVRYAKMHPDLDTYMFLPSICSQASGYSDIEEMNTSRANWIP